MLLDLIAQDYTFQDKVIIFFTFLVAMLLALMLHELAHAFVAVKCGDPTPKAQGRLTFNPMAHLEPMGFISFMVFGFGWAKPVQINTFNFKNFKRDTFLVSIAGVCTNILLAFIVMPLFMLLLKFGLNIESMVIYEILYYLLYFIISLNVVLFIFNLFPIYPLDGFNAIASYLRYENQFVVFMKRFGAYILLGVLLIFDLVYATWDIDILNYLCYYITWPLTQFWTWVFGYSGFGFNVLGTMLFGVM